MASTHLLIVLLGYLLFIRVQKYLVLLLRVFLNGNLLLSKIAVDAVGTSHVYFAIPVTDFDSRPLYLRRTMVIEDGVAQQVLHVLLDVDDLVLRPRQL